MEKNMATDEAAVIFKYDDVDHLMKGRKQAKWTSFAAFYWYLLKNLLETPPTYDAWGKLLVMQYNQLVLDVDLDLESYPEVKLCGGDKKKDCLNTVNIKEKKEGPHEDATVNDNLDPSESSSSFPAINVPDDSDEHSYTLHLDDDFCGNESVNSTSRWSCPIAASLCSQLGDCGLQVRYSVYHGIYVLNQMTHPTTNVTLHNLYDSPSHSVCRVPVSKPILAFNASVFNQLATQFHIHMHHYPHVNEVTVKALLRMCLFVITLDNCDPNSSTNNLLVRDDVMKTPLWFVVINVRAFGQVLLECTVRHIIRRQSVQWQFDLKGVGAANRATNRLHPAFRNRRVKAEEHMIKRKHSLVPTLSSQSPYTHRLSCPDTLSLDYMYNNQESNGLITS